MPDTEFIKSVLNQGKLFFKFALLPELLGKYYSRLPMATRASYESEQSFGEQDRDESLKSEENTSQPNYSSQDENQDVWCYSRAEESG